MGIYPVRPEARVEFSGGPMHRNPLKYVEISVFAAHRLKLGTLRSPGGGDLARIPWRSRGRQVWGGHLPRMA